MEGKLWVVDVGDEYIHRINPATNTIEISKRIPGGLHYGYSDMTGLIANTITTKKGTWTIIHDSGLQNAPWGIISWHSAEPQGTSIKVRVRTSNDQQHWSDWEETNNGAQLSSTSPGRYLQAETTFQIVSGNLSPTLYDLRIRAPIVDIALTSQSSNPTPHPGDIVQFTLKATNNGPTDASGVNVKYRIPSGFRFISSSSNYNNFTNLWSIGNLFKGDSTSLIITAQCISPGRYISSAWVFSQGYDINMANNVAIFSVRALSQPLTPQNPPSTPNINPDTSKNINPDNLNQVSAYKEAKRIQRTHNQTTVPMQETGIPLNFSGLAILLIMFGNLARRKRIINNKFFWIFIAFCFIFIACGTVSAADNTTICVSNSNTGEGANGCSNEPYISSNGQYVTFSSDADNIVPNDNNYQRDIFVYQISNKNTERVSISSSGEEANGDCYEPSINGDGRYVVFTSYAHNLITGDNNNARDIFVHDRLLKTTERVSISSSGKEANGDCYEPSINGDGRYVTFTSWADNLVLGDNNGMSDVFIHDRLLKTTARISVSSTGEESDSQSFESCISADGRYVAFTSYASNLVPDDTNGMGDIFLKKLDSGVLYRISNLNGEESNDYSKQPAISSDGRYIAFTSYASNLAPDDNNGVSDIFVYDHVNGSLERVSISSSGEEGEEECFDPSISFDGRFVVFTSGRMWQNCAISYDPTNGTYHYTLPYSQNFSTYGLLDNDDNGYEDVFIRDRLLGITNKVSLSINGDGANDASKEACVSGDGQYIAFSSNASNLVLPTTATTNIFIRGPVGILPSVSGSVSPKSVKSGDSATITAMTTPDTVSVTATIMGQNYSLNKDASGIWSLNYVVPIVTDGDYPITLKAMNMEGHFSTVKILFNVDNTPPHLNGQINPNRLAFLGGLYDITADITATSDSDTASITANIFGNIINLNYYDGVWSAPYTFWKLDEGNYSLSLTATDHAGNTATKLVYFTADNSPPTLTGNVTPEVVRSGDSIIITANPDPAAEFIRFSLFGETIYSYNGNSINYTVPQVPSGIYPISIMARYGLGVRAGYNYFIEENIQLNLNVDNTPPTLSGTVTPSVGKQGNIITVDVSSDPDTASVTARILGTYYPLSQKPDGTWTLDYTIPYISDGNYNIELSAVDRLGHAGTGTLNFIVDSTLPVITASLNPEIVKSGDIITVKAYTNPEAQNVNLLTSTGKIFSMVKQADGSWLFNYRVPQLNDGIYNLTLVATNLLGHQSTAYVDFSVDNTSPTITASLTPNITKPGDLITVNAYSDPDTASITAWILENTYNLEKKSDGTWSLDYTIPSVSDGHYTVILNAQDKVGNQGRPKFLVFKVDSSPVITGDINPKVVKSGDSIQVTASTDSEVESLTARIFGDTLNMEKQADGTWSVNYTVPEAFDGKYFALLTATNSNGNHGTAKAYFTVDNTPPAISAEIIPGAVNPGEKLQITADASEDAESVQADFGDEKTSLTRSTKGWSGEYNVPTTAAFGTSSMSFSATDPVGNTNTAPASYDILDPTSNTNPNNPGGSPTTPSSPTDRTTGSSGGSMGGGTGSSHTQTSKTNTNSNNGGSNNSNSEGITPGGGNTENISPEKPQEESPGENFIGELLLELKDLWAILGQLIWFFIPFIIICGLIGGWSGLFAALFLIFVCIVFCVMAIVLSWAIKKLIKKILEL